MPLKRRKKKDKFQEDMKETKKENLINRDLKKENFKSYVLLYNL